MLFLLSPSKKLDYASAAPLPGPGSTPLFTPQAAELINVLRKKKPAQVAALMGLSDSLAALNVARYAAWQPEPTPDNSKPALFAFAGDVYAGLDAASLDAAEIEWAEQHLVLLSGLYGVLRPLDALQPYRLEMGSALRTRRGRDLYGYWGDRIAAHLNQRLDGAPVPVVVNLASIEYARAALRPALKARVVDCVFEDWKDGRYKIISFLAKRARGLLARHAVRCRAERPEDLLSFDADGYGFDAAASVPDRLVFRRRVGG